MGLLSTLFPSRGYRATYRDDSDFWYQKDPAWGGTMSGFSVGAESSLKLGAVYACVTLLADMVGMLPLITYRNLANGGKERAKEHPYYQLLRWRPNARQTAIEWRKLGVASLLLRGNFYNRKVLDARGRVEQLIPLHPDRVKPVLLQNGRRGYIYRPETGPQEELTQDEICHVEAFSTNPEAPGGCSIVEYARETIGRSQAEEAYAATFWRNNAEPPGVLQGPTGAAITREQRERIRQSWQEAHSGPDGWHKVAILEGGMTYQRLGLSNRDAQWIEGRSFSVSEIARWFRIPPFMIGDVERSTCLPGDALILTEHGPRPISEVQVGQRVWSMSEDGGHWQLSPVWRAQKTGHDPILRIETRARVLRCNAQHRVLVRRKFPDPRPGYGGYRAVSWRNVWIEAGEIRHGDFLVAPHGLPDGVNRTAPNGRALTEGFMQFAGLLIGDGSVLKGAVGIARHDKAPYMPRYREIITAEFQAARLGSRADYSRRQKRPVKLREYARCTMFSSVGAANELRDLGLAGVAKTKRVPGWVFGLPPDLILAFLGGYVDSDGAVNERGWVTFSSCNPLLLEDVRHLCMIVGVPVGTVRRYRQTGECMLNGRPFRRGDMYQLFAYDTTVNKRILPNHPLKRSRLGGASPSKCIGTWSPEYKGRGPKGSRPGETFDLKGCTLQRVSSVTVEAAQDVWDLGVRDTHTFVADGILVHNSWGAGIEQQFIGFLTVTLQPMLVLWEQALQRDVFEDDEDLFSEFLVDALLRGDMAARASAYSNYVMNGIMSENEVRVRENLNPFPGLDEPRRSANQDRGGDPRVERSSGAPEPRPRRPASPAEDPEDEPEAAAAPPGSRAQALALAAATVAVRREVEALRKQGTAKHMADTDGWREWLEAFYGRHAAHVAELVCIPLPTAQLYVRDHRAQVLAHGIGVLADWEANGARELAALALAEA